MTRQVLEGESSLKTLEALRVSLQSNTIPWLKSFGAEGGLELLLNLLQKRWAIFYYGVQEIY